MYDHPTHPFLHVFANAGCTQAERNRDRPINIVGKRKVVITFEGSEVMKVVFNVTRTT